MFQASVHAMPLAEACTQRGGVSGIGVMSLYNGVLATARQINKLFTPFDQGSQAVELAVVLEQIVLTATNTGHARDKRLDSNPPSMSALFGGNECLVRLSKREGSAFTTLSGHANSLTVHRRLERESKQLVLGITPPEAGTHILQFAVEAAACDLSKKVSYIITHECRGDAMRWCQGWPWRVGAKISLGGNACLHWSPGAKKILFVCFGNSITLTLSCPADTVSTMQQWVRKIPRRQSDRARSLQNLVALSWLQRLEISVGSSCNRLHFEPVLQHHQKSVAAGMQLDVHLAQQPVVRLRVRDMLLDVDVSEPSAYNAMVSLHLGSLEVLDLLQEASLYPLLLAIYPSSTTTNDNGPRVPEACAVALTLRVLANQQSDVEFSAVVGTCRFVAPINSPRYLFAQPMTCLAHISDVLGFTPCTFTLKICWIRQQWSG